MFLNKLGFFVKKAVCCVLAPCLVAFSFSGCSSSGTFALKCGEHEINSEEFLYIVTNTILSAPSKIDASSRQDLEKLISEGSIEGKSAVDWIKEQAIKSAKNFLAARKECKELGKEVPEDYKKNVQSSIDESYDEYGFSDLQITKEAIQQHMEDYKMVQLVSEEYFGEGKTKYVDDERADEYSKEHGLKYKMVKLNKLLDSPNIGEEFKKALKNEGVSSVKELAAKYMDQIAKGKTIDDINAAFNKLFGMDPPQNSEQNFVYRYDDEESSEFPEKQFVVELDPGAAPVLREDEGAYYIIQRFEIDQAAVEKLRGQSRNLLSANEFKSFMDEQAGKCEITVNKEVVDKVDIPAQAKLIAEGLKKMQENRMNKMSQDKDDSDGEDGDLSQEQEDLGKKQSTSSGASEEKAQQNQGQPQEQKASGS